VSQIGNFHGQTNACQENESNFVLSGHQAMAMRSWESYHYATTKMSATKQPMLSFLNWLEDHLKKTIVALPQSAKPTLWDGLVSAHRKLSHYCTKFDDSCYYSWAACSFPCLLCFFCFGF
jgi:hypothetical protein